MKTKQFCAPLFAIFFFAPALALAQEVYNFHFVPQAAPKKKVHRAVAKKTAPKIEAVSEAPVPAPTPAPIAVVAPPVIATPEPAPIQTESITKTPAPIAPIFAPPKWQVAIGAAKVINYAEEVQGFAFGIERELTEHFAVSANAVTGHPVERWDASINADALAWTFSVGGAWTPLHLHPGLIKSIDLSALAGVMNTRGHSDDTVANFQIQPYVGAGCELELTSRLGLLAQIKFERADLEFGEGLGAMTLAF